MRLTQSKWGSYALALTASLAAIAISHFFQDISAFLPCIAAVMLISWQLGRGPGTFSSILFLAFTAYSYAVRTTIVHPADTPWRGAAREIMFIGTALVAIMIADSQRKTAAREREQGEWLRFALANVSNGVIGADERGRITYINAVAQRLTGYGDDALGKTCAEVFRTVSLATKLDLEDPITKALRDQVPARFSEAIILISKDGRRYIVEDGAVALTSPEDSSKHAVLVFRDVTEQRRVEVELRSTADRYRLALEVGKLVPWEWIIATDELISDRLKEMLPGAKIATREDYLSFIHPDDHEAIRGLAVAALAERKNYTGQYRFVKPNGEIIWVESHAQPFFNERGEPVKLLGVLRDTTEQKLVDKIVHDGQEQFRNVAESASDGFVTVDEKGKMLYANGSFAALYGYKRSELIGQHMTLLLPDRMKEAYRLSLERYIETGVKTFDWRHVEYIGRCKDGTEVPVEMSYSETRAGNRRLLSAIVRNISQRKKDAEAMLAARQRLELAQRIAGMGTYQWDFRGIASTISAELATMFGLQSTSVLAGYEDWEKIVHPDDIDMVRSNARIMLQQDLPEYSSTYRVVWPDKSVHWIASKTKMFRNEQGEPQWALGVALDITKQKEAEAEREKMLAAAMAARVRMELAHRIAGIGTFEWDATTSETHFSPELEALYGLKPGEFKQTYAHWTQLVHPEDLPRVKENSLRLLASDSNDYAVEFRVIWPDGSVHWITTKGILYRTPDGKPLKVVGVEQDVTHQKQAEAEREKLLSSEKMSRERLELAQRAAGIGIYERNLQTDMMQCSPELLKLMGMKTDVLVFRYEHWLAHVHPEDRQRILTGVTDSGKSRRDYYLEYRVIWPNGIVKWLASSGKVISDAQGTLLLSVGATVDITERKAIDAQRERIIDHEKAARNEAERVSQLKDQFLATVSHELRTPLTAIIGWSQMLNEPDVDPKMLRRGLESIERNGRAQAQLVEDLLDVSRIATGQMRIQMQPLDLADLVRTTIDGVRPAAQAKKITLVLNLNPIRVSGDTDRLHQVAFNILFNAVKFSESGGRVEVSVGGDNKTARLTVRDDGKGIDPTFLPKLFQRFTQEDASSTRRYGGMGLGLAIVRHLVELHGGSVRADSDGEGTGTTLTVELPSLRRGDSVMFQNAPPSSKLRQPSDSGMTETFDI